RFSIASSLRINYPAQGQAFVPQGEYLLESFQENMVREDLLAGATYQRVGLRGPYSYFGGTIRDITANLSIPSPYFTVVYNSSYLSGANGNYDQYLFWYINVSSSTPPGFYNVSLEFKYTYNGVLYTERVRTHKILVYDTPLIRLPDTNNFTTPVVQLQRNATTGTITIPVTNSGNVNLRNVIIRLDLDNAAFFKYGDIYINESNNGVFTGLNTEVNIGDLNVGQTKNAVFTDVYLASSIPPGMYLIPIDYIADYSSMYPMGGNTPGTVVLPRRTIQWDESPYSKTDYGLITYSISWPEPSTYGFPFILVEVTGSTGSPYLRTSINGGLGNVPNYNMGATAITPTFYIYNYEKYPLYNCVVKIRTDGSCPFSGRGTMASQTVLEPYYGLQTIYGASASGPWTASFTYPYPVDIKSNITAGLKEVPIIIEGRTSDNQPVNITVYASVFINPRSPDLQQISQSTQLLNPKELLVTLGMRNIGAGAAYNLSCYLDIPFSNGYTEEGQTVNIGTLSPGGEFTVTFKVIILREGYAFGVNYNSISGTLYCQYNDEAGNFYEMFKSNNMNEGVTAYFDITLPEFTVSAVEFSGEAVPGASLAITATLQNTGGSTAYNTSVLAISSSNILSITDSPTKTLGTVEAGGSKTATFNVKISSNARESNTYYIGIRMAFQNVVGQNKTFSSYNLGNAIAITMKDEPDTAVQVQRVEYENAYWEINWGYVFLGLFIAIGLIGYAYVNSINRKTETPVPQMPVSPPQPATPVKTFDGNPPPPK
ncbi:MAG: hypothetical protein QW728_05755, partial [Thermoplasmata archaeon]